MATTLSTTAKKQKTCNNDNNSTTSDNSMETNPTQATISTVANLKHEIMASLRQEITQIIQTDVQSIQTEIHTIQQNIAHTNDQTKHNMKNFHQQLSESQAIFQQQMNDMNRNFQHQMQIQQAQMTAFFQPPTIPNLSPLRHHPAVALIKCRQPTTYQNLINHLHNNQHHSSP